MQTAQTEVVVTEETARRKDRVEMTLVVPCKDLVPLGTGEQEHIHLLTLYRARVDDLATESSRKDYYAGPQNGFKAINVLQRGRFVFF